MAAGTRSRGVVIVAAALAWLGVAAPAAIPDRSDAAETAPVGDDALVSLARDKRLVVIADFGLGLCRQCKAQAAILERVAEAYRDKVVVRMVAVNREQALTERYGVETIPHLVFLDRDGTVRLQRTGVMSFDDVAVQLRRMGVAP